jgi:hypothetical protein
MALGTRAPSTDPVADRVADDAPRPPARDLTVQRNPSASSENTGRSLAPYPRSSAGCNDSSAPLASRSGHTGIIAQSDLKEYLVERFFNTRGMTTAEESHRL